MKLTKKQGIRTALWCAVSVILIIALTIGNIFAASFDQILSDFFGRTGGGVSGEGNKAYVSDYESKDEALSVFEQLNREIVSEGTVLM